MTAKESLDSVLAKTRVHYYKPIQIAEILYRNRLQPFDLTDLTLYRTKSKAWRDAVSYRLVGSVSISSSRFQDNIFEDNALSPAKIAELGQLNNASGGAVEAYIYLNMQMKLGSVHKIYKFLRSADPAHFRLVDLFHLFGTEPGLRRSMDKVFEITTYALFDVLLESLDVSVTVSLHNSGSKMVGDFDGFSAGILGFERGATSRTARAKVFRVGATNANDDGLDMWANYGPAIQIKHIDITASNIVNVAGSVSRGTKLIIVCRDSEVNVIDNLVKHIGAGHHVQSIVTYSDISRWYETCFSPRYQDSVGLKILDKLRTEFDAEFPANLELPLFLEERGYTKLSLPTGWTAP